MNAASAELQAFEAAFDALARRDEPEALRTLRARALETFLRHGLPTTRDEEWRGTSVAQLGRIAFVPADEPTIEAPASDLARPLASLDARERAVLEAGLVEMDALERHPFVALNSALAADGLVIRVPRGEVLREPIVIRHRAPRAGSAAMAHPRVVIELEENAQATVVQVFAGSGGESLTNVVTQVVLHDAAVLDLVHEQVQGEDAWHVAALLARVGRQATLRSHSVTFGARLSRQDADVLLAGEGASCEMFGTTLLAGAQHADHHVFVDHAVPHGTSRQLFKGAYGGRSRGVFCGRVRVRKDAQHASAQQDNRSLILSGDALVDTRPQLEILADDVRCTHGATIGQIDEDPLFYLRARGISEAEARHLLARAFVAEPLFALRDGALRESLERLMEARLQAVEAA